MARSLNKVQLIGNITRDAELRKTPAGASVCTFGLATNRAWTKDDGSKHDEVEFHTVVAWNKLADICGQFCKKGLRVYVEGRLATRTWEKDSIKHYRTEIVIDEMMMLDAKGEKPAEAEQTAPEVEEKPVEAEQGELVSPGDIPF